MVQTDSATRKSVDLLAFCILESNADFVLRGERKKRFNTRCCYTTEGRDMYVGAVFGVESGR